MAVLDLHDAVIKLDNGAGTATAITDNIRSGNLSGSQVITTTYNLASRNANAHVGGKTQRATLVLEATTGASDGYGMVANWWDVSPTDARTLLIGVPDDSTADSHTYSGEFYIENFQPVTLEAGSADPMTAEVAMVLHGALTYSVVSV